MSFSQKRWPCARRSQAGLTDQFCLRPQADAENEGQHHDDLDVQEAMLDESGVDIDKWRKNALCSTSSRHDIDTHIDNSSESACSLAALMVEEASRDLNILSRGPLTSEPPSQSLVVSPQASKCEPVSSPSAFVRSSFVATLDHSDGSSYGCQIQIKDNGLEVCAIRAFGLVDVWNKNNPTSAIEVGDTIWEINGVSGGAKVEAELIKFQCNQMRVRKAVWLSQVSALPSPSLISPWTVQHSDTLELSPSTVCTSVDCSIVADIAKLLPPPSVLMAPPSTTRDVTSQPCGSEVTCSPHTHFVRSAPVDAHARLELSPGISIDISTTLAMPCLPSAAKAALDVATPDKPSPPLVASSKPSPTQLRSTSTSSYASLVQEQEFVAILDNSDSMPYGIRLRVTQYGLLVSEVFAGGRVESWNKQNGHCTIESGDAILEVNGVVDPAAEKLELEKFQRCHLRVRKAVVVDATLDHSRGASYGVRCRVLEQGVLITKVLEEGGLVHEWNQQNKENAIEEGDILVNLHGHRSGQAIESEMKKHQICNIRFRKACPELPLQPRSTRSLCPSTD